MADAPEKPLVLRAAEGRIVRTYQPPPAWMHPIVASMQAQRVSA